MKRYVISILILSVTFFGICGFAAQDSEDPSVLLHHAVVSGDLQQVESLISGGVDINTNNQLNWTPLHTAVRNNRIEIIKFLLENGVNVNAVDAREQTALQFAVESGQKEIVELLIEKGADLDILDERGESATSLARKAGQAEIAVLLIENGASDQREGRRAGSNRGRPGGQRGGPPTSNSSEQTFQRRGLRGNINIPNPQNDIPLPEEVTTIEETQPSQIMEIPSDPNEIQGRIKSFEGLEEAILDVVGKSRVGMRQWRRMEEDNRALLARAVQRQLEYELEFVQEVAIEENATKTAEATSALLAEKGDRLRIINRELNLQEREAERQSRTTTSRRGSSRTSRTNQERSVPDEDGPPMSFEEEEETDRYDPETQSELDVWLNANVEEVSGRTAFANTVNERIREEFGSIRQIAAEEEAAKTMASIDGLLLARQERFEELAKQLETAQARAEEADEERSTRRSRTDQGTTDQESGRRRSRR